VVHLPYGGARLVKDPVGWHICFRIEQSVVVAPKDIGPPVGVRPGRGPYHGQRRTYEQIAAIRARQTRRRAELLHKATTDLTKSHGVVVMEDLRVRNLTRSARGTIERPGSNVRAKAGLNRSILTMAWGKTGDLLAYKCSIKGRTPTRTPPKCYLHEDALP
jgi:transposase